MGFLTTELVKVNLCLEVGFVYLLTTYLSLECLQKKPPMVHLFCQFPALLNTQQIKSYGSIHSMSIDDLIGLL